MATGTFKKRAAFLPLIVCLFLFAIMLWSAGLEEAAPITLVICLIPVGLCFYHQGRKARRIKPEDRELVLKNLTGSWNVELLYDSEASKESNKNDSFVNGEEISRSIALNSRVTPQGSLILDTLGSILKVLKAGDEDRELRCFMKGEICIERIKEQGQESGVLKMKLSNLHSDQESIYGGHVDIVVPEDANGQQEYKKEDNHNTSSIELTEPILGETQERSSQLGGGFTKINGQDEESICGELKFVQHEDANGQQEYKKEDKHNTSLLAVTESISGETQKRSSQSGGDCEKINGQGARESEQEEKMQLPRLFDKITSSINSKVGNKNEEPADPLNWIKNGEARIYLILEENGKCKVLKMKLSKPLLEMKLSKPRRDPEPSAEEIRVEVLGESSSESKGVILPDCTPPPAKPIALGSLPTSE